MNNKILNLDNKMKLKKTVENNIIYLLKNYGQIINYIKTPFISYRKEYLVAILYNNVKILLIIEEIYNPLTMNEEYIIFTTNSENNNNNSGNNNKIFNNLNLYILLVSLLFIIIFYNIPNLKYFYKYFFRE